MLHVHPFTFNCSLDAMSACEMSLSLDLIRRLLRDYGRADANRVSNDIVNNAGKRGSSFRSTDTRGDCPL